jgi:SSS family solute:Na+ symporter
VSPAASRTPTRAASSTPDPRWTPRPTCAPPPRASFAGWDGAVLPIGLGLSLVLNGIFFAKPLNEMKLLTLPDLFARRFGPATEVLFSFLAILSFCCLLGGNLVGAGRIIAFLFGFDPVPGIWLTTFAIWLYTVSGGLISVAYTDVAQAIVGWTGLFVGSIWVLYNMPTSAGASPAFPNGDTNMKGAQMTDADALGPELGTGIPNAIVFNWITIFVLGFGNLAALDFQARVFSARTPKIAVIGCIAGGIISWIIGVTFSFTSGAARALYGPSSPYAEFVADSCSEEITVIGCFGPGCEATVLPGVPTCGEWKPDPYGPIRMFTCTKPQCHYAFDFDGSFGGVLGAPLTDGYFPMNGFIGGWILIAIVAASMSTGDGAILAMSTVFSHNLLRKLPVPFLQDDKNLLVLARLATLLWAPIAAGIASADPDNSGYLLIVAFDIMLAGSVVPLFAAVYWPNVKPIAAFVAMLGGSLVRLILEYALPKDGLLLLVGAFAKNFGPGAYGGINVETGVPLPDWCPQHKLKDFTGIDSIVAPAVSLLLLLVCHFALPNVNHPMFKPTESDKVSASAAEVNSGL